MPVSTPALAETWELRDVLGRAQRGFVADVSPTIVTLVALTGSRIKVPASNFTRSWVFIAEPPKTNIQCGRCRAPGILRFYRGVSPDYVCPKHLPIGVMADLHTPATPVENRAQSPKSIIQCPECGNMDPVEDARLVRLERGNTGWWTCTLCSARWGLIAEPTEQTDNRGRWYVEAVRDLLRLMAEQNVDILRIEASRLAWLAMRTYIDRVSLDYVIHNPEVVPDSGYQIARFEQIPLHMVAALEEGSILIRARNASPGSSARAGNRPTQASIQRIGGVGDRTGVAGERTSDTITRTIVDAFDELWALEQRSRLRDEAAREREAARRAAPLSLTRTPPEVPLEMVSKVVSSQKIGLPRVGDRYFERKSGKVVTVIRVDEGDNGMWAVAIQDQVYTNMTIGNSPYILWMNDFLQNYVPYGQGANTESPPMQAPTLPEPVNIGDEWFAHVPKEYVRIQALDLRRMTATALGRSTGRTYQVILDDFADSKKYEKLVRKTIHQRLMDDEDE